MPSAAEARAEVLRMGAEPARPRHFEDNVLYDDAARSLRGSGRTLRLRRAAGEAIVTFKGPRIAGTGVKSRVEVEFAVADGDAADRTFLGIGYERVFRYQKYREAFRWRDVEIVVDETPIGVFVEIEGPVETIHAAAAALGRGPADYVDLGYVELLAAAGRDGDMLFG
jgi:adenylate cyclase class 2